MKLAEFNEWYMEMKFSIQAVYHRGYLPLDKGIVRGILPARNDVADEAWLLAEAGKVHLVQRRRGDFDYEYIAIRAKRG